MVVNNKKNNIPYRNKSPYGWWVAIFLERFECEDENLKNMNRRCLVWENMILIKAKTREQAYQKALYQGKLCEGEITHDGNGNKGFWKFEGLMNLLPVYEELADGNEIMWTEHRRTVKTIKSWVRKKEELDVFIDDEKV